MILHLRNPITIIISKAIYGEKLTEIRFVRIDKFQRSQKRNRNSYIEEMHRLSTTKIIAKHFGLKLSVITWKEFLSEEKIIVDSNLMKTKIDSNADIILQGGDSYCVLGFKSYFQFLRTKIKLLKYWRNLIPFNLQNTLFIFNANDYKYSKANIKNIDINQVRKLSKKIAIEVFKNNQNLGEFLLGEKILLALPPLSAIVGMDFLHKFIEYVAKIAEVNNLTVVIKPHRGDYVNYSKLINKQFKFYTDYSSLRHMPVEFLFACDQVKKIVSTPSSSLVFAETSSLEVLVPLDRNSFRRYYLDQLVFLDHIGIKYIKI